MSRLPFGPPLAPMLARLTRELPTGDLVYEPKWDGFRALAFREGDAVQIRSRHDRPLARYFPELVSALRGIETDAFVLDGEIMVLRPEGFDFEALMLRLHPTTSRVERLSAESPATYVAFDLLAEGGDDLRQVPFAERRSRLERLIADALRPVVLTPATDDPQIAAGWLSRFHGGGADGVVAKHRALPYEPGRRSMIKVKHDRTADCVVAGFRVLPGAAEVGSLLLGLYDERGALRHVGVASQFSAARRRELLDELRPRVTSLQEHPWETGFGLERSPVGRLAGSAGRWEPNMSLDWIPVRPELVAEVAYDTLDGHRFRHPARFRRWRPDRTPASCTLEQLDPLLAASVPQMLQPA